MILISLIFILASFIKFIHSEDHYECKKMKAPFFRIIIITRIQVMCTFKAHINYSLWESFYEEFKKLSKIVNYFSFFPKKIYKMVY